MTSPLAHRRRVDQAHQSFTALQYRAWIAAGLVLFIALLILAIGHAANKLAAYEKANQEVTSWTLK